MATNSSQYDANYAGAYAINGERNGAGYANAIWHSSSQAFPQWLQVDFSGVQTIGQIDVFSVQDAYQSPTAPTWPLRFTLYGNVDFRVQYWTAGDWADVPGGNVTANSFVWRRFAFAPIATDKIRVSITATPDSWTRVTELEAWTPAEVQVVTPSAFNAFEHTTDPGPITGNIHTKVAATSFNLDVVAINTEGSALLASFTGEVKVELLDASGAGACATWPVINGSTTTATFAEGDAGRKAVTLTAAGAYPNARVRMIYPATGTAEVTSCSTDNFAIRPAAFAAFRADDADWASAGTTRALTTAEATGGAVHKAGRPFTLRASAVNSLGATTTNYAGTPTYVRSACVGSGCPASPGTLILDVPAASAGVINSGATYSEAGSFALQLTDTSFANVDAADGSSVAERTIASPLLTIGRFVPDHFEIVSLAAPVFQTFGAACATRAFTYVGQPFGYATLPQATVYARNAGGGTTANYAGALWKIGAGNVGQTHAPTPASPALDVSAVAAPTLTSSGNGSGTIAGSAGTRLRFERTTPLAKFNASIALSWSISDASEEGVAGNGTIATTPAFSFAGIGFDAGNEFRFGLLHLGNAHGSDLIDLPVPLEARYWDGVRFAPNAADQCTEMATSVIAMDNYQKNLAACETAIAPATLKLANGRALAKLIKPGNGNTGSVDLSLQLGAAAAGQTCTAVGAGESAATAAALPWLQGNWRGAADYDQNPLARASFGQRRSSFIYRRESY